MLRSLVSQFSKVCFLQNGLTFQIEVDEDGKIIDAKFKTFGCGSAIASSSLATEWIKGKTVTS
jgi:NifU-like protein involved in Fe-S cluster formation